ncbi:hypothetical protein KAU33_06200, partial [Candidatus Dependentiae bacterium]|nr:hypothetical protein [Candidatus Dependentiae bacterium]
SPYFVRDKDRLFGDEINFTPDTLEIIGNGFGWTYNKEEEKKKKPGDGKPSKIISEKDKKDKKVKSHDTSPSVSEDEKGTVVEKDKSPKVEPPTTEDIKESEEGKEKSKNVEPSKIEDLKESKKEKKGSHVIDQAPGKESGKDVKKELKKDLDPDDFVFFTFEYLFHDREKNVTRMKKFTMREGNIYIQADKIEMFGKLGKFKSGFGEGNIVVIDYSQNSMITGEAFRYDSDSGDVFLIGRSKIILGPEGPATKEPFIIQNDAWIEKHITSVPEDDLIEVEGYNLTFNRISKEASISNAVTYIKPWYIKSEKVLQVRKDIFWAEDSDITSCDEEIPHYYFRIKRLKIYTKDKMVARTMIGYFGRAPLLYFPYFIKDIDPVDSRWVVYLGQNQYEGYYWKNKYLIDMFKDRAHLALKFDYMSKLDWGRGFTYRYTSEKGKYRGFLNHYFNEDKITFTDLDGEEKNYYKLGYKWRGEHLHYLPLNSSLRIYIDRFSAPELNQNLYSDQVEEVAKRSEDTYVSLSNSYKAIYSLEILNQEKTNFYNDIETTYRKIPDVRLSFLSQKIPFVPVNYSLSTRYINYWNELYIQGGSTSFSLSTESFKLFRIISTNFQISESVYYVDKTMEENTNLWTRNFNGTTTISTKMWRIFNPEGVRKFKHTVSPRFSYNYTYVPENSRYIEREQYYFPDFMSVPVSGKSNRNIGLALNQNLQMKKETVITEEDKNILNNFMGKPQSEEMTKPEIRDIVSLEMSTNYNIDNRLWSDLNTLITSSFVKNFRLGLRITNDLDLWKLRSLSFNLSYNDQEHWDISSNLLYYPESAEFKTTMSNRVSWTMNDDFSIYFYSRYNFSGQSDFWHRLSSKEIGIEHSLHCWLLSVSWRQTYNLLADDQPETENMIWFKILLKAERSNKFSVENNFVTDQFSIMGNKTSSPF